jgi:hypothetical protein
MAIALPSLRIDWNFEGFLFEDDFEKIKTGLFTLIVEGSTFDIRKLISSARFVKIMVPVMFVSSPT